MLSTLRDLLDLFLPRWLRRDVPIPSLDSVKRYGDDAAPDTTRRADVIRELLEAKQAVTIVLVTLSRIDHAMYVLKGTVPDSDRALAILKLAHNELQVLIGIDRETAEYDRTWRRPVA